MVESVWSNDHRAHTQIGQRLKLNYQAKTYKLTYDDLTRQDNGNDGN
jgi:hypothetical protein